MIITIIKGYFIASGIILGIIIFGLGIAELVRMYKKESKKKKKKLKVKL